MARKIGSRYTAHQILGRGSAGTVWLGEGPEGAVAIKLLREDLASDQELVGRFVQERAALLSLEDPHVVGVRDLVVDGNDLALVMDLVRGTDLRTRLERERRLAPEAAVAIAADVADGLAAAHAARIVHRDVKPENVLLDMQGQLGPGGAHPALLTDFGIARLVDSPRRTLQPPAGGSSGSLRSAKVIGTPDYLAPEIIEGLPPRASVDVYALATVLYELLAGFTPFGGGHPGAVLRRHVTESVAPLPGIPDELWQLLLQCLAKAPASRLRAPELAARLRELLPGLAGIPPLDIDEPEEEQPEEEQESPAASREEPFHPSPHPGEATPPRGAVPLVQGAVPDSNRETHTSMRVPGPDELAGGAHGTARAPRAAGERRAGSARHRSSPDAVRRRRIKLGAAAAAVVVAAGLGGWLASGDDTAGDATPGVQQPDPGTP
ncbi:serine/threonine protein kinase [Streptomyces sp. 2224.1]|uniref:serine/threonine-protein kinase n=1 Tax=unclassified Streptomyces TaxID=2593676 RepID=UPI000885CB67|nr:MULTISPECIES: serine/threonine-protein kinase [unclassified Streptomyces]PBC82709.1 serine/threonine protein kinase [Streptomyces sp. 2321.6]SDR47791.1 serine/threonine protein kinase [Streptomyces sp. KS_16]SEC36252.1 serine/threonine protein kinase [Streptomyces sp. 2224.1]SEC68642.1 serine/threonine protein kinase [Streptomyces sp. 2133.1]SEE93503.1 serine/threonine protein kinase [Streptomyces sp. 2112.3]